MRQQGRYIHCVFVCVLYINCDGSTVLDCIGWRVAQLNAHFIAAASPYAQAWCALTQHTGFLLFAACCRWLACHLPMRG